jgi:hypothetical protein
MALSVAQEQQWVNMAILHLLINAGLNNATAGPLLVDRGSMD